MTMNAGRDQTIEIHVDVPNRTIELAEKYTVSAWRGFKVTWLMAEGKYPFAVKFHPGSDLKPMQRNNTWVLEIPKPDPAKPLKQLIYKYTISVYVDPITVLILDPVLAPIPPED